MSSKKATTTKGLLTVVAESDWRGDHTKPLDWKISRRIVRYMREYPVLFISILLLAILLAVINGALPHLAGLVLAGPVINAKGFEESYGKSVV